MFIKVNYDNAFRQATRLSQLADEHQAAADRLLSTAHDVRGRWQDTAGGEYVSQADVLAGRMRRTSDSLRRLSQDIRYAAQQYKATEEANTRAAKRLGN